MSNSAEELFEMESLKFEAVSNDVSSDNTNFQTGNSCTASFCQNGDSIDSNLSLRRKKNLEKTRKVSRKASLGRKQKKGMNQQHRNAEDILNGCKPFSICLTRLSEDTLKKLARYSLRTRSVMSVCVDRSRAKGKYNIRESKHLQNENYSEKQVSLSEGNKDENETVKGRIEMSNGTVNYQCKVKRPLLDKNIYGLKENQVTECVKKQGLNDTILTKRDENASEIHTKSVEYSLKTNADKVDRVEVLETFNNAGSECKSAVTKDKSETEIIDQNEVKPRSLQIEELEYTEYIRNFLMEHCMLHTVSENTIFPEKCNTIDDKKVTLSQPNGDEDGNEEVIAWKYKRKRAFISSDSEDSHNEEMSYGKRREIQRKHKTSMRRMENVRNIHKESNRPNSIENIQTVYLSNTWSQQNSEKESKDFIKANTIKELKVNIAKLKDTCIPSTQIKECKEMLTMNDCITESRLDNYDEGLPQCKDSYYDEAQLRLLPCTKSFSQSLTEHKVLKDLLSIQSFDVTNDIPNSDSTCFNIFYKTNSQEARSNNKDLCSKLISSQKCIRDKESSLEDDKKYNAKVSRELNQEILLKAKYGIMKELTVFLIKLEIVKNYFTSTYSASEIEGLTKKYSNFSVNSSTLRQTMRTPQLPEIVIIDVPCNNSKTVAAYEPVSNYPTISYQPLFEKMELLLKPTDKSSRTLYLSTNKNNESLQSSISPKCLTFSCTGKNVSNIIQEETSNKGLEYHCQCSSQYIPSCEGDVHNVTNVDENSTYLHLSIDNSLNEKESLLLKKKTTNSQEKCVPKSISNHLTNEDLQETNSLPLTGDYIIRATNEKPFVKNKITGQLEPLTGKLVDPDSSSKNTDTNIKNLVKQIQSVVVTNLSPETLQLEDSNEGILTIDENDQKNSSVSMEQNTFLNATIDKNHHEEQHKSQITTKPYKRINSEQLTTKNYETSKEHSTKQTASLCNKKCNTCRKDVENEVDLSKHSSVCRYTSKDSPSTPKYNCSFCGRKYMKEKQLEIHLRTKHNRVNDMLKNYDCSVCSQTFASKECLSEHVFKHTAKELQKAYRIAKGEQDPTNVNDSTENFDLINADTQNPMIETNVESLQKVSCPATALINTTDVELQQSNETQRTVEQDILQLSGVDKDSNSSWISMCSCHRNEHFTTDGCNLQIEVGLHCQRCNILYKRRRCFETHFRTSLQCRNGRTTSRKPQMFCHSCRIIIDSLPDMRNHLGKHQHLNLDYMVIFICHICKVVFFGVGSLFYSHWFNHSRNMLFMASRYSFPKASVIKNPRSDELTINAERGDYLLVAEYFCNHCRMPFSNQVNLQKHERQSCSDSLEETQSTSAVTKFTLKLICSICNKTFNSKSTFDEHSSFHYILQKVPPKCTCILTTSGHTIYICDACSIELATISELEKHWQKHSLFHEKFWCEYCNKSDDTLEKFLEHWKVHLFRWSDVPMCRIIYDKAKFSCLPCKLGFECRGTFDKHFSFHKNKLLEAFVTPGTEANRIDKSLQTLVTLDERVDIKIEPENKNVVPETLTDPVLEIESSTVLSSQEETCLLPNENALNNTISRNVASDKGDCTGGIFNAAVGTTEGNAFVDVVVMGHAERSESVRFVGSSNDYVISDHVRNSHTSTSVSAEIDTSQAKIDVPKFHIVILDQDRSSGPRSMEWTNGNAEMVFGTGEGNVEEQIMVEACSDEHDPLAMSPVAAVHAEENNVTIISEDVVKSEDPSDVAVVESKSEDQRPSVIERASSVEAPEQVKSEEAPKQTFLRVRSLTELQETRPYLCNVCLRKFDSSNSLQQHLQEHIPVTVEELQDNLRQNDTFSNVASNCTEPLSTTPDVEQSVTSSTVHQERHVGSPNLTHTLPAIVKNSNNPTREKVDNEVQSLGNSLSDDQQSELLFRPIETFKPPPPYPCTSTQSENTGPMRYSNFVITTKSMAQRLLCANRTDPLSSAYQDGGTVASALSASSKTDDMQPSSQFVCSFCNNFQHTSADEFRIHLSLCQSKYHAKRNQVDQSQNSPMIVNNSQSANRRVPKSLFLYEQRQSGSDARIYGCNACPNFKCSNGFDLSQHIKWHTHRKKRTYGRKRFSCMSCTNFVCYSEDAIRQHVATHVEKNRSAPEVETQQPQLSRKSCSPLQTTEIVNGNGGSTQIDNDNTSNSVTFSNVFYKCHICNSVQYSSNEELLRHLLEAHATNSSNNCYVCDYCTQNLAFNSVDTLRHHVDTYHNYICKLCSERFSSVSGLQLHELRHNNSTKASCNSFD